MSGILSSLAGFLPPGPGRILLPLGALALAGSIARAQSYPIWQSVGTAPGDAYGISVAGVGDLDGDGRVDLLVGAPLCREILSTCGPATGPGAAQVLSGATGAPILTVSGSSPGDLFGFCVAPAGHLDGDGVPDFLVGAPQTSAAGGAGYARAFSGASGAVLYTRSGASAGDAFGAAVASAGDVNGDLVPDLLVGIPGADPGSLPNAGRVKVFSGTFGGALLYGANGSGPGDSLGWAVASPGDLNGDGVPDALAGAPGFAGIAASGYLRALSGAGGAPLYSVAGASAGDGFGASLATLADTSGDGIPELLVGAPQAGNGGAGYARALSGANGSTLVSLVGSAPGDRFGWSVASALDVNGNGVADLLVGAPGGPCCAGYARLFSGGNGLPLLTFAGSAPGEAFGTAVAGPGDLNGDRFPDLLVGAAPQGGGASAVPGFAKVLSAPGLPLGVASFGTGCPDVGGFALEITTFGGEPTVPNPSFGLGVTFGRGSALAFLFVGTQAIPAGYPVAGCVGYISGALAELSPAVVLAGPAGAPGVGYRLRSLPIPSLPLLLGLSVGFQWTILAPDAPNGLFVASNAVEVTFQ